MKAIFDWFRQRFHRGDGDALWRELVRRAEAKGLSGDALFEYIIEASPRLNPAFKIPSGIYADLEWLRETATPEELVRFGLDALREALPYWEENVPKRIRYGDRVVGMRHTLSRSVVRETIERLAEASEKWGTKPIAQIVMETELLELCVAHDDNDVDFDLLPGAVLHSTLALTDFAADFKRRERFEDLLEFLGGMFTQDQDEEYEEFFTQVFQRRAERESP